VPALAPIADPGGLLRRVSHGWYHSMLSSKKGPSMKCPACGAENEKGAAFCYQCGSPLATAPAPSATGPTVALSPALQETLEQEAAQATRPPVPAAPPEPASGSRVYQVPGSPPSYGYSGTSVQAPARTSSMAIVALALGIISFLGLFFIAGIGAIATGHLARREISASGGQLGGGGMAMAGLVLGYLNVLLSVVGVIGFCLFFVIAGASFGP
jgi:hypothetical protein